MNTIEQLADLDAARRAEIVAGLSTDEVLDLLYAWRLWARPNQVAPVGIAGDPTKPWDYWLILAGRGFGKTRSGAEWVHEQIAAGVKRIALVARTAADIRDVVVEGESGILATAHPARRPTWNPSKRRLTWPNGAIATTFSAKEPNSLRGPQYEKAWCDELASWQYGQETWAQLQMVLRLGAHPQVCITTTPRPSPLIKKLVADPCCVVTRGSTFDNKANLPASTLAKLEREHGNTRLGRQELFAEILDDNPGALWQADRIEQLRVRTAPPLVRIVVAVDPSATENAKSCECGIVVAGVGADGHGYVLEDCSTLGTPAAWGEAVVDAFRRWKADRVVAETNLGGYVVENLLRTIDPNIPYKGVRAARGKAIRAEPVAALYEQGRVHHVGTHAKLEDQLTQWDPVTAMAAAARAAARRDQAMTSHARTASDRMDALVWALSELMLEAGLPDAAELTDFFSFRKRAPRARF